MMAAFSRLSTGIKMLLLLSVALLPLGLIALFASIESASMNRLARSEEARLIAADGARQLTGTIADTTIDLSGIAAAVAGAPASERAVICREALGALARRQPLPADFALADRGGRRICNTAGFSSEPLTSSVAGIGTEVRLLGDIDALRFATAPADVVAVGEFPRATLVDLLRGPQIGETAVMLRQGEATIPIRPLASTGAMDNRVSVALPIAGGQLQLEVVTEGTPLRAIEALLILSPILMWLAAALIGWLVVDRLLLRPLAEMENAITAYGRGNRTLVIPASRTPAQEIRSLGEAFRKVTDELARHEAELEQGLARQTKLTREVHHRVKNNLQVVSSLINLHARGVTDPAIAAAFLTIQRRVEALSAVHRHHFAELEENRGLSLRALIGELAQNLRSSGPGSGTRIPITLELAALAAHQDTAVPIAFLLTELLEAVMTADPARGVTIQLAPISADRARLTLTAPGLMNDAGQEATAEPRFRRIVEGFARQLRSPIDFDEATGTYMVEIPVVPE